MAEGLDHARNLAARHRANGHGSNELWAVANERDGMGDGLVPDHVTLVQAGVGIATAGIGSLLAADECWQGHLAHPLDRPPIATILQQARRLVDHGTHWR